MTQPLPDAPAYMLSGDCRTNLLEIPDASIDAVVTDPPYELNLGGNAWDRSGVAFDPETWRQCLRVLKPGGHLLAFGGSRTYHRMTVAVEDAGFHIRDEISAFLDRGEDARAFYGSLDEGQRAAIARLIEAGSFGGALNWIYTSGFPKSVDLPKALAKAGAAEEAKDWPGWGTALKPAHEPILMARKPLVGTIPENVLAYGVGGVNVDGCRIGDSGGCRAVVRPNVEARPGRTFGAGLNNTTSEPVEGLGRWPTNVVGDEASLAELSTCGERVVDAPRFFHCPKPSTRERGDENVHPTVKPVALMRWLCRLVTPPGGVVLDPFLGSGTSGVAAVREGFRFVGIEQSAEFFAIAWDRVVREIVSGFRAEARGEA